MHLADQGEAVVGHALGEVEFPQRAAAVQGSAGDLTDDLIEFSPTARGGHVNTPKVIVEVHGAVFQPHRMVESGRNADQLVTQRVEQMQPPCDGSPEYVEGELAVEVGGVDNRDLERVCRFGVSLYSSMASMPLSRFTSHPVRGRRLYRSTTGPNIRAV